MEQAQSGLNKKETSQIEDKSLFSDRVEISYYEVCQHEKFQFNIHNFKRYFNMDLLDQK